MGSEPGFRRPVLVVQADAFNRSAIGTVVVVGLTSTLRLLDAPGNVLLSRRSSGLARDAVINVSQLAALDRGAFDERVGIVSTATMRRVEDGMRLVLALA